MYLMFPAIDEQVARIINPTATIIIYEKQQRNKFAVCACVPAFFLSWVWMFRHLCLLIVYHQHRLQVHRGGIRFSHSIMCLGPTTCCAVERYYFCHFSTFESPVLHTSIDRHTDSGKQYIYGGEKNNNKEIQ